MINHFFNTLRVISNFWTKDKKQREREYTRAVLILHRICARLNSERFQFIFLETLEKKKIKEKEIFNLKALLLLLFSEICTRVEWENNDWISIVFWNCVKSIPPEQRKRYLFIIFIFLNKCEECYFFPPANRGWNA